MRINAPLRVVEMMDERMRCKERNELYTGVGVLSINGKPVLKKVELLALVELRWCKSDIFSDKPTLVLSNVLRVGAVIDGNEYLLGGFKRIGNDATQVMTRAEANDDGTMIGEALIEGGWVRLPRCGNCSGAVKKVIDAVNRGYSVLVTLDLKNRKVISVDLISPRRAEEIMANWYLNTSTGDEE